MPHDCSTAMSLDQIYPFNARGIAKRFRHAAIFGVLDALPPGEIMRFSNDHDPLSLLSQIDHYFEDRVQISYVSREPGNITIDFEVVAWKLLYRLARSLFEGLDCRYVA